MERLKRLYERYEFSASAEITDDSGSRLSARASNISFGGCRLLVNRQFRIGTEITVKIDGVEDVFEASARIVHSSGTDMGLMFGKMTPDALFVLQKWIADARYVQSLNAPG